MENIQYNLVLAKIQNVLISLGQNVSILFVNNIYCVKSVRIRSYSGPHFPAFPHIRHSDWIRRDTEYLFVFSPNVGKCGKNADQNNSEYGHFLCSDMHWETLQQFSTRKLDIVQNLCEFCQFFLSDFWD